MTEWRPIPGFPIYEASDEGQIRRARVLRMGPQNRNPLSPARHHRGYLQVTLTREDGKRVSVHVQRLIAAAFHGAPEAGAQARHLDGNPTNNRAENLKWGTASENTRDQVRHGTHRSTRRGAAAVCANGHERTPENVRVRRSGRRDCITCIREQNRQQYLKRKQAK